MTCDACGLPLVGKRESARYCNANCRTKASQRRARGVPELKPAPGAVVLPPPVVTVRDATLAELSAAGRVGSALGAKALAMAARIDAGADTGAGLAALVKQHDATMAEAVRGSDAGDVLDELSARREARRGA